MAGQSYSHHVSQEARSLPSLRLDRTLDSQYKGCVTSCVCQKFTHVCHSEDIEQARQLHQGPKRSSNAYQPDQRLVKAVHCTLRLRLKFSVELHSKITMFCYIFFTRIKLTDQVS